MSYLNQQKINKQPFGSSDDFNSVIKKQQKDAGGWLCTVMLLFLSIAVFGAKCLLWCVSMSLVFIN